MWAAVLVFGLLQLQLLLDCSDGELARWRGPTGGARGVYVDNLSHWVTDALMLVGVRDVGAKPVQQIGDARHQPLSIRTIDQQNGSISHT